MRTLCATLTAVLGWLLNLACGHPPKMARVDAAFRLYGEVVFISGADTLDVFRGKEAFHINGELQLWGLRNGTRIDAAWSTVTDELQKRKIFLYAGETVYTLDVSLEHQKPRLEPGTHEESSPLLDNGGPDAAVKRGHDVYFFKGCQMAVRRARDDWDQPTDLAAGIPCHLDAAWRTESDGGASMLLKGNQVWSWHANGTVTGPVRFDSLYKLNGWVIQPAEDL